MREEPTDQQKLARLYYWLQYWSLKPEYRLPVHRNEVLAKRKADEALADIKALEQKIHEET